MRKVPCFECGKVVYTVRWYPNYQIICDECEKCEEIMEDSYGEDLLRRQDDRAG